MLSPGSLPVHTRHPTVWETHLERPPLHVYQPPHSAAKTASYPDALQVAPDVDAALKEQLEEMGFSAHRCEPWEETLG